MKKGFTMLEVIVSIAITGIILALLTMAMNFSEREYSTEKSRLYDSSTARAVQLEIEEAIKGASYATCSFDNLGIGEAPEGVKRLIYVKPQEPGAQPYILALKNNSGSGWELHRLYYDGKMISKKYVNAWRQQGTSTVYKARFAFDGLTGEEMDVLNSQVDGYIRSYMLSGLNMLSSPPAPDIGSEGMQYYKEDGSEECFAYVSSTGEASLVYLENIKYEYFTSMDITADNLVMDGIENMEIIQDGRDSFQVTIRCGEEEYTSSITMRSYVRGVGLEKK